MLGSSTRNIANDEGDGPSEKEGGYSSSSAKEKSTKIHLEFEFLDFLVASTFLFCDWIDFVSRDSSSIVAKDLVSDDSDDEDVEYKGHFCSGCSIPPPGGVRGWVRGYGGVGLWEAGPGCACCEDYD